MQVHTKLTRLWSTTCGMHTGLCLEIAAVTDNTGSCSSCIHIADDMQAQTLAPDLAAFSVLPLPHMARGHARPAWLCMLLRGGPDTAGEQAWASLCVLNATRRWSGFA